MTTKIRIITKPVVPPQIDFLDIPVNKAFYGKLNGNHVALLYIKINYQQVVALGDNYADTFTIKDDSTIFCYKPVEKLEIVAFT